MKMFEFRLKFHWSLFPKGPINNIPALIQIMAWRRPGDKPLVYRRKYASLGLNELKSTPMWPYDFRMSVAVVLEVKHSFGTLG